MQDIQINKVTIAEIEQLQNIGKQTFLETFSSENTEENMNKYLQKGFSIDKLMEELSHPDSEFYFACVNNHVIGYLKINYGDSQTELKDKNSLEIERIYVLKEFHGKNVGQQLYEKAISIARELQVDHVWLGVWEKNARAIHFYQKNGFKEFDKHIFRLGDDEQTDIMMKQEL
ncbi:MAG: GNAT family N-acetyltransferase [Bacteroidetes bacterium]|nr:GNAT family N-acetyltransferase [Bacteroidota bacterium]